MKNNNGFFSRLVSGLSKTRSSVSGRIEQVLKGSNVIDDELYDELEEILITSDIGVRSSTRIMDELKSKVKEMRIKDPSMVRDVLKDIIKKIMTDGADREDIKTPSVIMVVGVNGVGKTTSIGKLAGKLKNSGFKVLMAAGDTFRAAAIDQLCIWGGNTGVDVIKQSEGSDPAAVVFDAVQAAKSRKTDVLICDTAGRLHNKKNLMDELKKINNVVEREYPESHSETLLVLDATTGQNAVIQAKEFNEVCSIDGIILTKLDGTARGGIVIAIKEELNIPVKYVGVGEGIDDLQDFDPESFVDALFEDDK